MITILIFFETISLSKKPLCQKLSNELKKVSWRTQYIQCYVCQWINESTSIIENNNDNIPNEKFFLSFISQ